MMRTSTQKILASCMLILLKSGLAFGQADSSKMELLTLKDLLNVKVTTASKTSITTGLAPATVLVITKEQIRNRGYQSLLDLMYDLPDVKIDDKMYSGMRNSITVRGIQGSEKFMILIDGVNVSSPSGEAMAIMENYPVNLAEQVEVVFGPASALYGANAVSGIINIITQKAYSSKSIHVEASLAGGTYGYSNNTLFISKKVNEHINFIVSGQYSYDKGVDYSKLYKNDTLLSLLPYSTGVFNTIYGPMTPVTPVRPVYEAPMQAYNIYAALHIDAFTLSFFRNYFNIPTSFGSNTRNTIFNKEVFMGQGITTINASYKKVFDKMTSTTSVIASEYNLDPRSNYRNLYTAMEPAYKYSTCSMVKAEEQLDYKASEKLRISAGAAYESYNAVPQSADLGEQVNKNDYIGGSYLGTKAYYRPKGLEAQFYFIKYYNGGTYVQAQYSPSEKVHITAGMRYDFNSRYGSTFNPRVGVVYHPSEKTTIKALYGTAFLAPSPSDSYVQYGSFDTPDSGRTYHSYFLHLPNPNLKPIESQSAEVSFQQYITDNLSINLDAYYTALSGLHEFRDDNADTHLYDNLFNGIPVDYIEVFINEEKQRNYGGSLRVNWKHRINNARLNSYAALSYADGVVVDPDAKGLEPRRRQTDFISPFMLHAGTEIKSGRFIGSTRLIIMGRQRLPGIAEATPKFGHLQTLKGYTLLNLSLKYAVTPKLSLFANISNALNQRYRSVGFNMDLTKKNTELLYGQPEDPIRITGGLTFSF